jgi:hypothetical protein
VNNLGSRFKPSIGSHTKIWDFSGLLGIILHFQPLFNRFIGNFQDNFLMIKYKFDQSFVMHTKVELPPAVPFGIKICINIIARKLNPFDFSIGLELLRLKIQALGLNLQ